MKVLLTGGTGFIGSHTAVELINAGHEVIIVDDLSNSSASVVDRIETIAGKRPEFYEADVADYMATEKVFSQNKIDAVIHFAGFKAVGESVEKPVMYYRNNIDTTLTLLELMEKYEVNNIVFSSSATVYGDPEFSPIPENAVAGRCASPYGRTKYFIEHILTDTATANKNMSVALLRYFNPIGAHPSGLIGEKPNGIPNNLMPYITQTAAGIRKELSVFGNDYPTRDGTGVRDYIHVVDLAKGHVKAVEFATEHKGTEIFNLGTGKGSSVLEIINTFEEVNGVKIPYVIAPRRFGDVPEYFAGTQKAEKLLNWKAELTLKDMCRDSWNWQMSCDKNKY